jgi:hypothetical protein
MARLLRIEYPGALYHVTARGNERKRIYFAKRDYLKFREDTRGCPGKIRLLASYLWFYDRSYDTGDAQCKHQQHYALYQWPLYTLHKQEKRSKRPSLSRQVIKRFSLIEILSWWN